MFFITSYSSIMLVGNLFVASYIFGVIAGNTEHAGKSNSNYFNNSLSWLVQALMFMFLGLHIFMAELKTVFIMSILPALLLIFVARLLAVLTNYLPFKSAPWSKRVFVSFIGLKGTTPIVFAIIPLIQSVSHVKTTFNMVFFIVIFSV